MCKRNGNAILHKLGVRKSMVRTLRQWRVEIESPPASIYFIWLPWLQGLRLARWDGEAWARRERREHLSVLLTLRGSAIFGRSVSDCVARSHSSDSRFSAKVGGSQGHFKLRAQSLLISCGSHNALQRSLFRLRWRDLYFSLTHAHSHSNSLRT